MTSHVPATAKEPKKKRADAYIARLTIAVPLDMSNADSLAHAIGAVKAIEATLPAGSTVEIAGSLGKV